MAVFFHLVWSLLSLRGQSCSVVAIFQASTVAKLCVGASLLDIAMELLFSVGPMLLNSGGS